MSGVGSSSPGVVLASHKNADGTKSSAAVALTVHRFRPAPLDVAGFTRDLAERIREGLALPGLIGARVMIEYGGSRVVLVAEWDSASTEIVGSAALYRDARLSEILRRSTEADSTVYTAVDA